VAALFQLEGCLHQPLRTLSGGETVRLAMARAYASAEASSGLTVASPFSWLSRGNLGLLDRLCERFGSRGLAVEILALEGEDSDAAPDPHLCPRPDPPLPFRLELAGVRLPLSPVPGVGLAPAATVSVADLSVELASPCLLLGENGQGKSLVARVLAGIQPHGGSAHIAPPGGAGRVRLLFQDILAQALMRTPAAMLAGLPPGQAAEALALCRRLLEAAGAEPLPVGWPRVSEAPTLLQLKALLAAIRIAARPAALILDEPDWGLTRAAALGLTAAVLHAAQRAGIAVLLISHKPWWHTVAAGSLAVGRQPAAGGGRGDFRIVLTPDAAGRR
jgi:energy-coupling factor transporter ATP-binding protein EcfA2